MAMSSIYQRFNGHLGGGGHVRELELELDVDRRMWMSYTEDV